MKHDLTEPSRIERYAMLASAISGRRTGIASSPDGVGYTDGNLIYVPGGSDQLILATVVVQASLLALGSIEPQIGVRLMGRNATCRRFLTLEAVRAMYILRPSIPRRIFDRVVKIYNGPLPETVTQSIEWAGRKSVSVPDAPAWFGAIYPMKILRAKPTGASAQNVQEKTSTSDNLSDPEADDKRDDSRQAIRNRLTKVIPTMQNPIADFLQNIFGNRREYEDSDEGTSEDLPVRGNRRQDKPGNGHAAQSTTRLDIGVSSAPSAIGPRYPEWNCHAHSYRMNYCSVVEYDPESTAKQDLHLRSSIDPRLRKQLARLGLAYQVYRRQPEGDGLDVNALIELIIDRRMGSAGEDSVYQARRRTAHDLGVLILLDASGSTGDLSGENEVFEQQRQIVASLTAVFDELGDRVATFAFSSQGPKNVRVARIKDFDQRYDHSAQSRLAALRAEGATRLGAAIRHGVHHLSKSSGTSNMLLVVVSDGLPYDDGYEDRYAQEDSRKALKEAVAQGVGCACIAVGSSTKQVVVQRVWGHVSHRQLNNPLELADQVWPLFRDAMRVVAVKKRLIERRSHAKSPTKVKNASARLS